MAKLIARIDDDLYARFKAKVALDGKTIQDVVEDFVRKTVGTFGEAKK